MEGGAMVLADGGVVCIDEFDKMREDDRVAIHEAMEQQTISIAKAGITTTLNSRCSVLAAANSIFGRWDDTKGEENIDFMPTILSRFDMIFIVKDIHDESRDITLAKHIINVHLSSNKSAPSEPAEGEISLSTFKKYIHYCRTHCGPRRPLSCKSSPTLCHRVRFPATCSSSAIARSVNAWCPAIACLSRAYTPFARWANPRVGMVARKPSLESVLLT